VGKDEGKEGGIPRTQHSSNRHSPKGTNELSFRDKAFHDGAKGNMEQLNLEWQIKCFLLHADLELK
jgi:hypothetical protein